MRLPKKENIYITGPTDPIHRHYHPVIKYFMNRRLEGALKLMEGRRFRSILDVGYGGGVLLPELATRCDELYGVDIHGNEERVREMLEKEGVEAILSIGDVTKLPFPDNRFDCVVCVSVLEFVKDLDRAFGELARVVSKDGIVIIGFPVESIATDVAFSLIRINARKAHPVNHNDIIDAARRHLSTEKMMTFPRVLPLGMSLFVHYRMRKR